MTLAGMTYNIIMCILCKCPLNIFSCLNIQLIKTCDGLAKIKPICHCSYKPDSLETQDLHQARWLIGKLGWFPSAIMCHLRVTKAWGHKVEKADAKSCRHLRMRASKPSTQNGRHREQKVGKCVQLMGMISWPTTWLQLWCNRKSSCASSNLCVHMYCKCVCVVGCEYLPTSLYLTSSAPYRHTKLESPVPSLLSFTFFL